MADGRCVVEGALSPGEREEAVAALSLILDGQRPPFQGRVRERMAEAIWFDSAEVLARAGVDYFGPVGRRARPARGGLGKANVADTTNVVWIDLDPPDEADLGDEGALVARAESWLLLLRELGLPPSVFVFSGRGSWAYWKLDRHVPQEQAEELMQRLYGWLRPDGSEHDVSRVARMPGSVNAKTGLRARVLHVEDVRCDPVALAALIPDGPAAEPGPVARARRSRGPAPAPLAPGGRLPSVDLPEELGAYMKERPSKRERRKRGIDGSAVEQAIVARLVNAGCSDEQIALFFDHHALPRHTEERATPRGYGWLATGIARARAGIPTPEPSVSAGEGSRPTGGARVREVGWSARRWVILRDMPDGLRKLELLDWVKATYRIKRSQALRDLGWLEDAGYIAAAPDPGDGRAKRLGRTQKATDELANRQGPGIPFKFLKGLPAPKRVAPPEAPEEKPDIDPSPAPEPVPARPSPKAGAVAQRPARRANADAAERRRRERALINDVHRIHIRGGPWTYLQLITPPTELVRVLLHEQLRVGMGEDALPVHRSFMSPRDPGLGGPEADDAIEERTLRDGGYEARDRVFAVAAVLAPTAGGFELGTREEGGEQVPDVGLLVQAYHNFFRPLLELDPTGGSVLAVRKRGQRKKTTYEFRVEGDGIELPADHGIDLDALLGELADQDAARAVLDALPDDWPLVKRVPG